MHPDDDDDEFDVYDGFEEGHRLNAKPPFWWPVAAVFDFTLGFCADVLANAVEYAEWTFHFAVDHLLLILMPWRWFRDEGPANASEDLENFGQLDDGQSPTMTRIAAMRDSIADNTLGRIIYFGFQAWGWIAKTAERLLPRRILMPLFWLFDVLLEVAFDCFDFVAEWWYSRYFPKLRWALPAILLTAGLSFTGVMGFLNSDAQTIRRYKASLAEAEESKDAETASLLKRKLEQLGFEEIDVVEYKSAVALENAGEIQEAYGIMRQLAPTDRPGMLKAHLWIAGALLDDSIETQRDTWELLESHVETALALSEDSVIAKRYQVELLLHQQKLDEAVVTMEEICETFPSLHAALAHEYHTKRDFESARTHARKAVRHYEDVLEKSKNGESKRSLMNEDHAPSVLSADEMKIPLAEAPGRTLDKTLDAIHEHVASREKHVLTPMGFLRIAEAYHLLDDFDAEQELLETAVAHHPDSTSLPTTLKKFYVAQLKRKKSLSTTGTAQLIEKLCRLDRADRTAVTFMVRGLLAERSSNGRAEAKTTAEAAWTLVRKLQDLDLLDSKVFQVAGDYCLIDGEYKKASDFYSRTCKLDPEASFAWNNLASVWSSHEPLNMSEAMKAANRAIQLNPDPRFYDTRGQIHVRLEQWTQAIEDLETAISGSIPNAADAHRGLVIAYTAIGKSEQADAHRKMLNMLVGNNDD